MTTAVWNQSEINDSTVNSEILAVAEQHGAKTIDLGPLTAERLRKFEDTHRWKLSNRELLVTALDKSDRSPKARYDIEYGTWRNGLFRKAVRAADPSLVDAELRDRFPSPNYGAWSPLMQRDLFNYVVGIRRSEAKGFRPLPTEGILLDVACGCGDLLNHIRLNPEFRGARSVGIDISETAIEELRRRQHEGSRRTLSQTEEWLRCNGPTRAIFLSYFIDRDPDQRGTLQSAMNLIRSSGRIVLEGLFPVIAADSNGISYAGDASRRITPGKSAAGDVQSIINFVCSSGGFFLECAVVGKRLVYSLDGFEQLHSTTLAFVKDHPAFDHHTE